MRTIFQSSMLIIGLTLIITSQSFANPALENRVTALERAIAELRTELQPIIKNAKEQENVENQRTKARERMRKDRENYSSEELREIEKLYQVANKNWRSPEAKSSLEKLISDYDNANRTGCATLYLGQMHKGELKEKYLQKAIETFEDCYYGNGVQVGAYAHYLLAYHYKNTGNLEKANVLFDDIRQNYPDAISHKGKLLINLIPKK